MKSAQEAQEYFSTGMLAKLNQIEQEYKAKRMNWEAGNQAALTLGQEIVQDLQDIDPKDMRRHADLLTQMVRFVQHMQRGDRDKGNNNLVKAEQILNGHA